MDNTCGLDTRPAQAIILIGKGGTIKIKQPNVINITVSRTRGQLVGTANGSFHYKASESGSMTGVAGSGVQLSINGNLVFTGTIKRIDISPDFRCAGDLIIKFSAEDYMHRLQGRNFTRRQKHAGLGVIAFITGLYKRISVGFDSPADLYNIERSASPVEFLSPNGNIADWTQFLKGGETNTIGLNHPVTRIADQFSSGGGGGMTIHDHSSLAQMGPSVATFGTK